MDNLQSPSENGFLRRFWVFMDKDNKNNQSTWSALSLAWQLGYSIAIPLVVLALLGRLLDKKFGTSPWLLLAGVLVSLVVSTFAVYFKTIKILEDTEEKDKEDKNREEQK